jgi:NAD(P)-dependent dehydrogenase (short-subunit alcohol dehydrogenase family)
VEREIREAGGVAFALAGDVSDKDQVYPLLGRAAQALGPLDILINNASTLRALPQESVDTDCEI